MVFLVMISFLPLVNPNLMIMNESLAPEIWQRFRFRSLRVHAGVFHTRMMKKGSLAHFVPNFFESIFCKIFIFFFSEIICVACF